MTGKFLSELTLFVNKASMFGRTILGLRSPIRSLAIAPMWKEENIKSWPVEIVRVSEQERKKKAK
jgi:hypothetical protein